MNIIRLQGETELRAGIYYEYDMDSRPLGEGGMGRVFKGYCVNMHTGKRTPVAIKAIYENIPVRVIERARREAEIQIDHDNLIRMYGFVESVVPATASSPAKTHYHVVMELLIGVTLEDILNGVTTDKHGAVIPFAGELLNQYRTQREVGVVRIMKSVLSGLMSLHDRGIIHRDIDPSNIMITIDNKIKLIDFGICKQVVSLGSQDKGLTSTGVFMGKVNYAAPELVIGDVKNHNYTTDIYSLGVMLYQLMAGHLPFKGTDQDILAAHLRKPLPMKDVKGAGMKSIIRKATEKNQSKRFRSAAEMRVALEHVDDGGSTINVSPRMLMIGGGAIVTALLCGILIWQLTRNHSSDVVVEPMIDTTETSVMEPAVVLTTPEMLMATAMTAIENGAEEGKELLSTLAADSAYIPAMLELGILKAYPVKEFSEVVQRRSKLGIEPDVNESNRLLRTVIDSDPSNFKAHYWLYNNLMYKFDHDQASVAETEEMGKAFKLFKTLAESSDDPEAERYLQAMKAADDENTLRVWTVI